MTNPKTFDWKPKPFGSGMLSLPGDEPGWAAHYRAERAERTSDE